MTEKLVNDILEYIEKNLYEGIKVEDIANHFYFSRYYLLRVFKRYTNLTINEYINQRKIIKSIYYIVSTNDRILKIALNSGFNSLEYYSEIFYKITNFSPLEFRKNDSVRINLPFDYSNNLLNAVKINSKKLDYIRGIKSHTKILTKKLKK